jgi:hypothetical protein
MQALVAFEKDAAEKDRDKTEQKESVIAALREFQAREAQE